MGIEEIIFIAIAVFGGILNFAARPIGEKICFSELKLKIIALFMVVLSVASLFIFGK